MARTVLWLKCAFQAYIKGIDTFLNGLSQGAFLMDFCGEKEIASRLDL